MNKVLIGMIAIGAWIFSHSFVLAQECSTCSQTPDDLQAYMDMVDTLLQEFPTAPALEGHTGAVSYQGKIQQGAVIQEAILQQILAPHATYDVYGGIQMIYTDESLQRDRKKLLQTQVNIINATMALVNSDNHLQQMPKATIEKIDSEFKNLGYLELSKIGEQYEMEVDVVTYETLARLLWQLQMFYEEMHTNQRYHQELYSVGEGIEKSNKQDIEEAIIEKEQEHLSRISALLWKRANIIFGRPVYLDAGDDADLMQYITFIEYTDPFLGTVWQIQQDYECSVGIARNVCNQEAQDMRKDSAHVFKEKVSNDAKRAEDTFRTARGRLKGVFKRGSTADGAAAKQREETLLNSYRGTDYPSKGSFRDVAHVETAYDPAPVWTQTIRKAAQNSRKDRNNKAAKKSADGENPLNDAIAPDAAALSSKAEDANRYPNKRAKIAAISSMQIGKTMLEQAKEIQRYFGSFKKDTITDLKVDSFKDTFFATLEIQKKVQVESVFNDVKRTTKKFPLRSAAIYNNMSLLGKKNSVNPEEGGWYYAMNKVCELQCTNLDGKICEHFGD